MAYSGTLKELSKAINAHIASPTLPLPNDISQVVEAYLHKHEKYDDASSERLQDELQTIYQKRVKDSPAKLTAFVPILRLLLPVIRTPARVFYWWDTLSEPVRAQAIQDRGLLMEGFTGLVDILAFPSQDIEDSTSDTASNPFLDRLLLAWMDMASFIPTEGDLNLETTEASVRETLLASGKKRPKDFMLALDKLFVKKEFRTRAARLLCDFVQKQPPHLYQILQTPLFVDLIRCLQLDTSTTVVSLALTALIMILPHMPSSLAPHLPTLFNIYARLLFWDSERTGAIEAATDDNDHKTIPSTQGWEMCAYSPDLDDLRIPHLPNYFTILYGLYPINFMDYIRKPQRYLRHANAENPAEVEVQPTEIRHKSEKLRQSHLLHPNFYTLTIESEKTDFGRWIRSEPAELVADCMALRVSPDSLPGDNGGTAAGPGAANSFFSSDESDRDGQVSALLSGSMVEPRIDSWRYMQSVGVDSQSSSRVHSTIHRQSSQSSHPSNRDSADNRSRELGGDSPTLPPHLVLSTSQTHLQDMIHSNKVIKSGIHQSLANDSVPSLALSHADSVPERSAVHAPQPIAFITSPLSVTDGNTQVAQLQRQILILQNDLSFERYLKQQHMAHIGELRRRHVREAATEAETQNLIMHNRHLKNQLEGSKKAEMQIRKESEKSRTLAKKWESDLSTKLKALREESRKLKVEVESLRRELQSAKQESEQLRKIVCDGEVKELNAKQNMQSIEINAAEIDRLKADVDRLTMSVREFEAKEMERQTAITAANEAEIRAEILNMKLTSRENELQRTKKLFQSQIMVLNSKLMEVQDGGRRRQAPEANAMVESALAASRAKQVELQKQYTNLMRKYTVLQSQYQESRFSGGSSQPRSDFAFGMDGDGDNSPVPTSPTIIRTRSNRVFSDPESFDPTSYNMTPPLEAKSATPGPDSSGYRPATPPGGEGSSGSGVNVSPEQRYFGRGGVQNRIRKEEKLKKKEEADKKDKKPAGLRGIRGLG